MTNTIGHGTTANGLGPGGQAGSQLIAKVLDDREREISRLREELATLREAAIALRDDLLDRAEWDNGVQIVCAGNSVWTAFQRALGETI